MTKFSESIAVASELRDAFSRATALFKQVAPKNHKYNGRSSQVRADIAITRLCNELQLLAKDCDDRGVVFKCCGGNRDSGSHLQPCEHAQHDELMQDWEDSCDSAGKD